MSNLLNFYKNELELVSAKINDLENELSHGRDIDSSYGKMIDLYKAYNNGDYCKMNWPGKSKVLYAFNIDNNYIVIDQDSVALICEEICKTEDDYLIDIHKKRLELASLQGQLQYLIKNIDCVSILSNYDFN